MPQISKRTLRDIQLASVYELILRDRFESNGRCFTDDRPDMWDNEQTEAFDMVTSVEDKLKAEILKLLGVGGK